MTLTVMRTSAAQRSRTKTEEGLRLTAYTDTVGIYTIGWGHASVNPIPVRGVLNGEYYEGRVCKGLVITPSEAERLFDLDVDEIERGASQLIKADVSQPQFDGVVDFCFQYGLDKFRTSDLLDRINFNPNSPAVIQQFMRWTRAGGEHQEYVWRRSARRCCIYNGTPIPQALWRKNGFPFALKKNEEGQMVIDYSITPTIEKIIEYGKKAAEKPVFDPSKPLPQPEPKPDPIVTVITDVPRPHVTDVLDVSTPNTVPLEVESLHLPEDELLLESVASPVGGSTVVTDSAPAKTDVASGSEAVRSAPPPVAPASVETQPPKKKDTMDTIAKDAGLDRSAVVKAVTAWMVWLGNSLRSIGAAGMKIFGLSGSSLSVIADQLQQPFVQIMVATAFFVCVTGAIWFVGLIAEKGALRVKVKAERAEAAT